MYMAWMCGTYTYHIVLKIENRNAQTGLNFVESHFLRYIAVTEGKMLPQTTDGVDNSLQEVCHIEQLWNSAATILVAYELMEKLCHDYIQ